MKRQLLTIALVASALTPLVAQDKPADKPPQTILPNPGTQVPLKVQFVLARYQGEKKVSSTPYMLGVLSDSQKTSLRMGIQVPVATTMFGAKEGGGFANIPQNSYTYRDIGTNIDCQAQSAGSGLFRLIVTVSDSSIHLDRSPSSPDQKQILREVPAFRSFNASFAMTLRDGQTMQYAAATDPISGEVMRIDVSLSLAK